MIDEEIRADEVDISQVTWTLADMIKSNVRGIICEYLFNNGIVLLESHREHFFDECEHNKPYRVMSEKDITIIFDDTSDDDYYPISIYYTTVYDNEKRYIDSITRECILDFFCRNIAKKLGIEGDPYAK